MLNQNQTLNPKTNRSQTHAARVADSLAAAVKAAAREMEPSSAPEVYGLPEFRV